ncbi:MAG: thiolase family protein [bacterium]
MNKTRKPAAIVGIAEWQPQRKWPEPMFALDAMAKLAAEALADAGVEKSDVDGLVIATGSVPESPLFAPAAVAEHLNIYSAYNEIVDLGGASPAAMVWRAAAAIEMGICDSVLILCPAVPAPRAPDNYPTDNLLSLQYMGGDTWGSGQSQFEIPAGAVAAVPSYGLAAQRYRSQYGLDEQVLAKIAVQQRENAQHNPQAIFYGKPLTIEDVMNSRYLAEPIKLLEAVMPCFGGAALLLTNQDRAKSAVHRPVRVSGYGEQLSHKSITQMKDFLRLPLVDAAQRAFSMAGISRDDIDLACVYDSFTFTVLLTLEASGFCAPGQGVDFIRQHDFRFGGDFPLNTHGGQLSFGQPGMAGGMTAFTEAVRQLQERADDRQVENCDAAYCTGSGGMLSEQVAVILEGA